MISARRALYALGLDEVDVHIMAIELREALDASNAELLESFGGSR